MYPKPKKRLGQNFLTDRNVLNNIIEAARLGPSDIILEIGAGRADLTRLIADKANTVYALEIDPTLCALLKDDLKRYGNIRIINQDILKFKFKQYAKKDKIRVIGNIPYYISSLIIERLINFRKNIEDIHITVQKEFAQRMTAPCGSEYYGSFSCFVQYYLLPEILFNIKKNSFSPPPKVDSCFLRLGIKKKTALSKDKEAGLFRIIRAAFGKRRKTLRNSLMGIVSPAALEEFLRLYGINRNIRPEELSLSDFINLAAAQKTVKNNKNS